MLPMDSKGYIRRLPRLIEPQQSLIVVNYSNLLLYTHSSTYLHIVLLYIQLLLATYSAHNFLACYLDQHLT
jgi:hypothetical protein